MAEKEIKATEQTDMDKLTTEMMEHICDNICKHPIRAGQTQDELEDICAECKMGKFVCDILNTYNRLNDFEKSQSHDLLKKLSEYRNLEEQGLLLKLPCKVGDVVYEFVEKIGKKGHWEEDKYFVDEWEKNIIREREFNLYMLASGEFGKTIFLTEQEAQAALEKMNRDKPKQYVLVSQGIEIYRTTDKEEAERMMNESNSKYYEYLQRCADEGERPADNMIYLYEEE